MGPHLYYTRSSGVHAWLDAWKILPHPTDMLRTAENQKLLAGLNPHLCTEYYTFRDYAFQQLMM